MEAWKVPSSSQYARMRRSISGKRGEAGVRPSGAVEARGYTGVLCVRASVPCKDAREAGPGAGRGRGTTLLADVGGSPGAGRLMTAVTGLPVRFY
ncbi:hypothetical protein GCM10022241_12830 [Micrococcus endophyticus]